VRHAVGDRPFDQRQDFGRGDLDHPHAFSANFIYDVPFFKKQEGIVGHVLGGWQLGLISSLSDGVPIMP